MSTFQSQDPFEELGARTEANTDEVYNFDDTYDGLGDTLQEDSDIDDDDTFGVSAVQIGN